MQSIVDRHAGCSFIFGGDLNVCKHLNNVCCHHINNFCTENKIIWLDTGDETCNYTYHGDANHHYSLIDYFLALHDLAVEKNYKAVVGW